MDRDKAIHLLTHDSDDGSYTGDLRVPCSRWGCTGAECAEVAWDFDRIISNANGEPVTRDSLEYAMSMVVNDHEDVGTVLYEHGDEEIREKYADELEDFRPRIALSSNSFGVDLQSVDAMSHMEHHHNTEYQNILADYPEFAKRVIPPTSGWFDTDAMGVDAEWSSWLVDRIEQTGYITWDDGEPYCYAEECQS